MVATLPNAERDGQAVGPGHIVAPQNVTNDQETDTIMTVENGPPNVFMTATLPVFDEAQAPRTRDEIQTALARAFEVHNRRTRELRDRSHRNRENLINRVSDRNKDTDAMSVDMTNNSKARLLAEVRDDMRTGAFTNRPGPHACRNHRDGNTEEIFGALNDLDTGMDELFEEIDTLKRGINRRLDGYVNSMMAIYARIDLIVQHLGIDPNNFIP